MTLSHFKINVVNEKDYYLNIDIPKIIDTIVNIENINRKFELVISFVKDEEISRLCQEYFGYAKFTDVLSFYSGEINPESGRIIIGDIIIAYPFAESQARNLNNSLMSEISLLIIHGFLHLLGYDHSGNDDKKVMWQKQEAILKELSIKINNYPES
jgi:probable rRNA maturation factor